MAVVMDPMFDRRKPFDEIPLYKHARLFGIKTYQLTSNVRFKADEVLSESLKKAIHDLFGYLSSGYDSRDRSNFKVSLLSARDRISYIKGLIVLAFDLGYVNDIELEEGLKRCYELNELFLEAVNKLSTLSTN